MLRTLTSHRSGTPRRPATRPLRRAAAALVAAVTLVGVPAGGATATDAAPSTPATSSVPSTRSPLTWQPPALTAPTTVKVSATNRHLKLDDTKDYVVSMPATPLTGLDGLIVSGGRNVVLIGGRIELPAEAITGTVHAGRGLLLKGQTGTVHVEGLHITGPGLEEGINIDAAQATVQLQNIRVDLVHGYEAGHHADVIQTWAGPRILRVDGLTGHTQYQGLFFLPTQYGAAQPELYDLRRTDIHGTPDSAYMIWRDGKAWPLTVSEVYVAPRNPSWRDGFLWPKGTAQGTASWPLVKVGAPPVGEFVPLADVGLGYTSPGYATTTPPATDPARDVLAEVVAVNPPVGALEAVTPVPGGLRVTGWATDRDTTGPVSVDLSVGGTTRRVVADRARTTGSEPGAAPLTGFDTVVPLPAGTHQVCAVAVDIGSGEDTALGCAAATVADTTAPTFTAAPVLRLRTGDVSAAGAVPVTVRWAVGDDVGVSGTTVLQPVTGAYAPDVTTADHVAFPGASTWTVGAHDAAGNVGTSSADATVTLVPEGDTTRYEYWWRTGTTQYLGGTALRSNRGGASMSHSFTGSSVAWIASLEASGGRADVYVDGVKEATVDLASPTTVNRSAVFTRSWDTSGTHTVKVVVVGWTGNVTSDGFVTLR
ncbi:hypothetical protein [Cellulomonas aerilata]|uniref:Uncharacterized protein n=1 Tax=Cellulomonas aerilata TaxID=515326 RepID=A0A512DF12_9CELL|nr:hypothetical protein [Cellulomonas aerilata]GEO35063.1 hypothetical protein CAE01nite_27880 [Cellulomonas aerilata]